MTSILISLSSFGAAEVRRHGQLWFAQLALQAGADGIEVRSELLRNGEAELACIATALPGFVRVFSSPEGLWRKDGCLDVSALQQGLSAARILGALRLKMSIGGYGPESEASLLELAKWLSSSSVELVVENDQSESAGTLASLVRFFEAADSHGLKLGMTFDMGNWHWTGECPLQAASVMTHRICYVHCKGVQRQPSRWVAVPLVESSAPWRAILRAQPKRQPWAIEYPLAGDDLLAVTRNAVEQLRQIASGLT